MNSVRDDRDILLSIERQLTQVSARMERLSRRQEQLEDLLAELGPLGVEVVRGLNDDLVRYEERGYFAMGRELMGVLDAAVEAYSPEDVRELAGSVVGILDTVRNLAHADVLNIVNEATDALHDADSATPVGVVGLAAATRDQDVQKGLAVLLEVLKHVGHAVRSTSLSRSLAGRTDTPRPAPRTRRAAPAAPRPRAAAPPRAAAAPPRAAAAPPRAAAVPPRAAAAPSAAPAVSSQFDAKGFLRDPTTWTMELADAVAATEGIPLTDAHWVVIRSARSEWEATGSSPNVRKLTQVADIPTRDLYTLFPRAPGLTIARLAGIPKPAGCL